MSRNLVKSLLLGVICLISYSAFAQQGGIYDVYDSSVVPKKGLAQQNEFWNNTYSFPAKPRNMWEIGISGGSFSLSSDVSAQMPTPGGSIHIQKALGYVFAIRAQYTYGIAKGLNWAISENFGKNTAWNKYYNAPVRTTSGQIVGTIPGRAKFDNVFYNYKATVQELDLTGIVTLNNIRFHKQKTGFIIYGGAGFGAMAYHTMVNALDANNQPYTDLFNSIAITDVTHANRKAVLKKLKDNMDNTYEAEAQSQGIRRGVLGNNTLRFVGTFIGGVAWKLGKRINLALEDKYTTTKDDLIDGQQWQENPGGDAALTGDFDSYNYLSLGLNFNLGAKSVEPLWWINPLDYAYSELNNPRHMKLPKPVFMDSDGDGVLDELDKEPNTPAGCPVDTHGVMRDTDGDGVPDCKDKQLITPTECQPVDADGVGKCPPPPCCAELAGRLDSGNIHHSGTCTIGDLPSITFKAGSWSLSNDAKSMIKSIGSKLKDNPSCTISINGYPSTNKGVEALCNKRVAAIKKQLEEKESISSDRIKTDCTPVQGGSVNNTVDIKSIGK